MNLNVLTEGTKVRAPKKQAGLRRPPRRCSLQLHVLPAFFGAEIRSSHLWVQNIGGYKQQLKVVAHLKSGLLRVIEGFRDRWKKN